MKSLKMNLRWLLCATLAALVLVFPTPQAEASGGSVGGCAYMDANGNLVRDEGEQLITGVPVSLERKADGAWSEAASAETDAYGKYAFSGLEAGEYRVVCTLSGQELSAVSVGADSKAENGLVTGDAVSLEDGQEAQGGDIALVSSARLEVTVFSDANGDGKRGEYDRGMSGISVEVMDGESALCSAATGGEGTASLYVRPGTFVVRVTLPAGYGPSDGAQTRVIEQELSFASGGQAELAIAATPVGSLGGRVFEDIDNDGVMSQTDPGVAGVTVRIEGKRTGTVRELTTEESGEYLFDFLPDDTYTISATLPEGMLYARYSQTGGDLRSIFTGSNLVREFPVRDAARVTDKNIGVVENGVISGVFFHLSLIHI